MVAVRQVRDVSRVLGLVASLFSGLQVMVAASAAAATQPEMIAFQRTVISASQSGDATFGGWIGPVASLFVATYLMAAITAAATIWLSWYAGRAAWSITGERAQAIAAARETARISSFVWIALLVVVTIPFHLDGTISWLLASIALAIFNPNGISLPAIQVISPGLLFIVVQAIFIVCHGILGYWTTQVAAEYVGTLAVGGAPSQTGN